jgi:hypothetical protein
MTTKVYFFLFVFFILLCIGCSNDKQYSFNIPDEVTFDDTQIQTKLNGGLYSYTYDGYYIVVKNGKKEIGVASLSSMNNDTCNFGFMMKNASTNVIDNVFEIYSIPCKLGIYDLKQLGKDRNRCTYSEEEGGCSSKARYNIDTMQTSFVKILSIEKEATTQKHLIRGRFKLYYELEYQKEGESFAKKIAFEEGAFWVRELPKRK